MREVTGAYLVFHLHGRSTDCDPEAAIASCQLGAGVVSFQDRDLLSEGEVFQQQSWSTVQEATDSSEEE